MNANFKNAIDIHSSTNRDNSGFDGRSAGVRAQQRFTRDRSHIAIANKAAIE
jgi:hypothetical protein